MRYCSADGAPRLVLTGRSAARTDPARMVDLVLDILQRWQAGQALRGRVDFARGY